MRAMKLRESLVGRRRLLYYTHPFSHASLFSRIASHSSSSSSAPLLLRRRFSFSTRRFLHVCAPPRIFLAFTRDFPSLPPLLRLLAATRVRLREKGISPFYFFSRRFDSRANSRSTDSRPTYLPYFADSIALPRGGAGENRGEPGRAGESRGEPGRAGESHRERKSHRSPRSLSLSLCSSFFFFFFFSPLPLFFQADVPHLPGVVQRIEIGGEVRGVDGHCPGGQQAIPLRVSPKLLAGRREGGSTGAPPPLRPPRLPVHRGPATKAGGLVREGEIDQQRHGQARPGKKIFAARSVVKPCVAACRRRISITSRPRENNPPLCFSLSLSRSLARPLAEPTPTNAFLRL